MAKCLKAVPSGSTPARRTASPPADVLPKQTAPAPSQPRRSRYTRRACRCDLAGLARFSARRQLSRKPKVLYHSFRHRAASWHAARRVVAEVEWHLGELFSRVGFIATHLIWRPKNVVGFHDQRGRPSLRNQLCST